MRQIDLSIRLLALFLLMTQPTHNNNRFLNFGMVLESYDMNEDGYDDLMVGMPLAYYFHQVCVATESCSRICHVVLS